MSESVTPKSNILVVDDEREHAQVMCEALTRLGHKCDVTYALSEAQSKLAHNHYDVVVTGTGPLAPLAFVVTLMPLIANQVSPVSVTVVWNVPSVPAVPRTRIGDEH